MGKKVVIIGAGVSGLSAGIYALQAGYSVEIYEKNKVPGGECTGWNRRGYHIDNCIHFLVGCNKDEQLYKMWENLGVISDSLKIYREPYFYCMNMDGITLNLWSDLEKARKELLELAPEDYKELNLFFDCAKTLECVKPPCDYSIAHMNPLQFIKLGMSMKDASKAIKEYGKQSMEEFVNRFKNHYIRAMFKNYFNINFNALSFVASYAFFTSNTAAIPEGGSVGLVGRMLAKFESLGGKLHLGINIEKINTVDGQVVSILGNNGEVIKSDNYIWCADPHYLFYDLIGEKYLDKNLRYMYDNPQGYVSNTCYQVAFGIATEEDLKLPKGSIIFPCDEYDVAGETHNFCGMRVYDYDETLFPMEKRVIQCNILQNDENYAYWFELKNNISLYNQEKQRLADDLRLRIEKMYPQLEGKLIVLGTYSPVTFTTWCNAYKGGYMSFNPQKGYKTKYVKSTIKGLNNLYLASQWIQTSGGLPIAAASGKFAIDIMKSSR